MFVQNCSSSGVIVLTEKTNKQNLATVLKTILSSLLRTVIKEKIIMIRQMAAQ